MADFTYNNDANSASWAAAMQAFMDQEDSLVGVELKLPRVVNAMPGDTLAGDEFQDFETLIVSAFADLIDTRELADIR